MKTTICMSLFLMLLASVCFSSDTDKARTEDEIRGVVFRYQIEKFRAAGYYEQMIFFLCSTNTDPDDKFMARFADYGKNVRKCSQAALSPDYRTKDKQTGEPGLILHVDGIMWINDNEVRVEGGYSEHGKSASGNTYYVERVAGRWTIIKDVIHWMS